MTNLLHDGPEEGPILLLAHGAGAPMDSEFMDAFAVGLANAGLRVVRFEFPYMAARRHGMRRPPDREAALLQTWRDVLVAFDTGSVFIGGKSMGGRMASMVADEMGVCGVVCLGYPFHAPGRPAAPRIAHLAVLHTPALIVQGSRDPFGSRAEVAGYELSPAVQVHWLEDGDHDFKPRAASGRTRRQNWDEGIAAVAAFVWEQVTSLGGR